MMPSSQRKKNTCSFCGRHSCGHVGPQGARCGMNVSPGMLTSKPHKQHTVSLGATFHTDNTVHDPEGDAASNQEASLVQWLDPAMKELINQVGKLSFVSKTFFYKNTHSFSCKRLCSKCIIFSFCTKCMVSKNPTVYHLSC
jgi:hypothetical protein